MVIAGDWALSPNHSLRLPKAPTSIHSGFLLAILSLTVSIVPLQLDTVLCVLTLNLYYEKIFLFLWYWMLLVAIICAANFLFWVHALFFHGSAKAMVRKYMEATDPKDPEV